MCSRAFKRFVLIWCVCPLVHSHFPTLIYHEHVQEECGLWREIVKFLAVNYLQNSKTDV
jgi:hypothetical protein